MVLEINGMHCGFLNVYAPNQLGEMVTFWTWLSSELLDIENWLLGGDFNMIEMVSDRCGGGNTTVHGHELACWERLCFKLKVSDAWVSQSFMHAENSLEFSRSNRR